MSPFSHRFPVFSFPKVSPYSENDQCLGDQLVLDAFDLRQCNRRYLRYDPFKNGEAAGVLEHFDGRYVWIFLVAEVSV